MQKVGMTKENIKKSINSQMLTVFLIPIIFACVHLAAVLPIIHKLLKLFGHNNMPLLLVSAGICVLVCGIFYAVIYKLTSPLLLVSAGICVLVCGIFYAVIYKLTSNAYYKIVS